PCSDNPTRTGEKTTGPTPIKTAQNLIKKEIQTMAIIAPSASKGNGSQYDDNELFESIKRHLGIPASNERSFSALCPAHDDNNPSLSVSLSDAGRLLIKCHAGCLFDQIKEALEAKGISFTYQTTPIVYTYCDEQGEVLFETVRKHPKGFYQ